MVYGKPASHPLSEDLNLSDALDTTPATLVQATPASDPEPVSFQIPEILVNHPRYRILRPLGSGGMGLVFLAKHLLMDRMVALKVLHAKLLQRPLAIERFCREVKALARVTHPNLVTAYDAEQAGDVLFLVMEYVEGESLDRVLRSQGKVPLDLARDWVRQVALGLQFAYEQGLVHRDIKPANLLLTPQGQIKILDFGLARLRGESSEGKGQTPEGALLGTPDYVAPEQARDAKTADIRADLYSLGCTWYEMLTGRPPFQNETLLQQLLAHQEQAPQPVSTYRAEVSLQTNALLQRLLAKDPKQRFQTPLEFLQALAGVEPASDAPRASKKRLGFWLGAAVLVFVTLFGAGWVWMTAGNNSVPPNEAQPLTPRDQLREAGLDPEKELRAFTHEASHTSIHQATAWIKDHNVVGPLHVISKNVNDRLDSMAPKGDAFVLWVGPKLVKSGRPTVVAGRHCDLFVLDFDSNLRPVGDKEVGVMAFGITKDQFHPEPPLTLSNFHIDENLNLDGDGQVTGSVDYKTTTAVTGNLLVRILFKLEDHVIQCYHLVKEGRLEGQGKIAFQFGSLYTGPMRTQSLGVMFVEVISCANLNKKEQPLVLSNAQALLAYVRDTKKAKTMSLANPKKD